MIQKCSKTFVTCSNEPTTDENSLSVVDSDDWEMKYDISLNILKEEYLLSLGRINNVDEKANKYLIVVSIIFLGVFTSLSSSSVNSLRFNSENIGLIDLLSVSFLTCLFIGIYYSFKLFQSLLKCLDLIEIRRMSNIEELLKVTGRTTSVDYKAHLIQRYQEAIEAISASVTNKQRYLKNVSKTISKATIYLFISLIILFFINIIG